MVEAIKVPMVEYGVAKTVLSGHAESGDRHFVRCNERGVLIGAIDGIGHGEEASNAAKIAEAVLNEGIDMPVISLIERCHAKLRDTRGAVMSLASVDVVHGLMTWVGVGNVQGVLTRADNSKGAVQEMLLLRGGVVGSLLPPLQATVLPITKKDTIYFVTDGIRSNFAESLTALENPQRAADRILEQFNGGKDDALALVVRLIGICQ